MSSPAWPFSRLAPEPRFVQSRLNSPCRRMPPAGFELIVGGADGMDCVLTDALVPTRDAAVGELPFRLCQRENTPTAAVSRAASPVRIPGSVVQNARKPPRPGDFSAGGGCSLISL